MNVWQTYPLLTIMGVIVLVLLAGIGSFKIMLWRLVLLDSDKLKQLERLHQATAFHVGLSKRYKIVKSLNSKAQLNRFNCQRYALNQVMAQLGYYQGVMVKMQENRMRYAHYLASFNHLLNQMSLLETRRRFRKPLIKMETMILKRRCLKSPRTESALRIEARYTSPQGRNSYKKWLEYTGNQFWDLLALAKEEAAYKETRVFKMKRERSKMTASMRFDVLKRDQYRCQICGRSSRQDSALVLHVDHIVPVARGGLTEQSNLQTLCQDCNLGKSAKDM